MIFRRSLSKKKGTAYSFFSGLSESMLPVSFLFAFQMIMMVFLPFLEFFVRNDEAKLNPNNTLSKDYFQFVVFGNSDMQEESIIYMILAAMGILGIFTAVRLFRFICAKKTVNVYYSLGIKRSSLFLSKFSSGAVLLCASTAIAVTASYILNLIYVGPSWQLSLVLLHMYCGLTVFLLLCFSLTAAVFSSVGTVSEAVVYAVAVLFAPTVFFFISEQIIGAFLPSSTFNEFVAHFSYEAHSWNSGASLLESTAQYNPVLFFAEDLLKYGCGVKSEDGVTLSAIDEGWVFPNIFIHVIWFVVILACAFAGAMLFRRIKAENCGFLNTNKLLSNLTIFELCLFGACLFLSEIRYEGYFYPLLMGVIVSFVLYIIAEIFLKRSFIKILKALYKYVAHMLVIAVIFGICATGAFGYDTYIPSASKVVSAEIAVPFSYSECSTMSMSYGWTGTSFINIYEAYRFIYLPLMTDREDIETVMEINRKINENKKDDGTRSEVIIRYNYEDGYSERKHILTTEEEIRELFLLRGTKAYGEQITKMFCEENRVENIKKEASVYPYFVDDTRLKSLCFDYDYSTVTAVSENLYENRRLELTKEQFNALKDAVYKDIMNTTSGEYFESTLPQRGVLSFNITEKAYKIEGVNGYNSKYDTDGVVFTEGVTSVAMPETFPGYEEFTDEGISDEEDNSLSSEADSTFTEETDVIIEEKPLYKYEWEEPFLNLGHLSHEGSAYDVIITDAMTNTMAVLTELGYKDCFISEKGIESVSFKKCTDPKNEDFYLEGSCYISEFFAWPTSADHFYEYNYDENYVLEGNRTQNIITDENKINELSSLMKLHEYTFNKGYYCLVKYDDGTYTVKYISEADAPDYVKQNVTM